MSGRVSARQTMLVAAFCCLLTGFWLDPGYAQETSPTFAATLPPRIARTQMQLVVDGEVVDVIDKGDLLTIEGERGDNFIVRTYNGRRGVVAKVNAIPIAEGADIYTELIRDNPDEGRLYTLRAGAYWEQGDAEKAAADFDKAIELGYDQAHAFVSRGLFRASLGQLDEAIQDYGRAIEAEPDVIAHRINRAAALLAAGRSDEAVTDYRHAVTLQPSSSTLHHQLAVALKATGDEEAAEAAFTQAIELDDKNIAAYMGRGYIRFARRDHAGAVEDFARVVELNPAAAVALNNRGYNLQQLGQESAAMADYDAAIAAAPEYGLAFQNKAWLSITASDEKLRDGQQALAAANRAAELSEFRNMGDLAVLAAAHAAVEQWDKAIGWQEKVVAGTADREKAFAEAILERYRKQLAYDAQAALRRLEASSETK